MNTTCKKNNAIVERIANSSSLQSLVIPKPTYTYAEGRRVTPKDIERLVVARRQAFSKRERGKAEMRTMSLESVIHRSSRDSKLHYC